MMLRLRQSLKQHSRLLIQSSTISNKVSATSNSYHAASRIMQSHSVRPFSLFKGRRTNEQQGAVASDVTHSHQRSQEDIIDSIEQYKKNIQSKTQAGKQLSREIAESVEQDKHVKLQRYEIFIDKMQRLYKSELRFAQKQKKKFQVQRNAILFSLTPLRDILRTYNDLTNRGFNSEATVETLHNIANVMRARGFNGRVQGDYTATELDQSVRMQKLVDDMKFGLREDQFFSPTLLAKTNLSLGQIGYKSTELIPMIFSKLHSLLDERQLGSTREQTELSFKDAVYGGPAGFVPRHYVFKGFQNSEEFNEYLQILMQWEGEEGAAAAATSLDAASSKNLELNEQASDLQRSMADIINAAVQVKEFQKDYQASIDNLRHQYFQMTEATDKHSFLQENQYIKYDLLELQELLVKGGYLEPDEASLAAEPFEQRMNRAADVFYDYVLNYAPELISPQYSSFYEAVVNSAPNKRGSTEQNYLQENQNIINLKTLSQSLIGLSQQALSYRRDVQGKDYLNKFYEDYLMPLEKTQFHNEWKGSHKLRVDTVMMERGYLKAWQLFKEHTDRIIPRLSMLVKEDKDCLEGQLSALYALNACRVEEPQLRQEILANCFRLASSNKDLSHIDQSSLVAGLKGLAESPSPLDDKARQLASRLASRIDFNSLASFPEQLDTIWSLCALQQYDSNALAQGLKVLNSLCFERLENDVNYEEYLKLLDIHNALRFESPRQHAHAITNKGLLLGLQGKDLYLSMRFKEHITKYDPFKQRVVQAISKGLTNASVEHQVIQENELFNAQTLEADVLNAEQYPYKPDIMMGYNGQKVGVFVLTETSTTRDSHQADGAERFRQRILFAANQGNLKLVSLPVESVVKYDIEGLQIELNKDFSFQQLLEKQIGSKNSQQLDFASFSSFGARLVNQASDFIEQQSSSKEVQKVDALIKRMYRVLQTKQQTDLRFEPLARQAGSEEQRFQLMKLGLLYDALSKETKAFVDNIAKTSAAFNDFSSLLQATVATVPRASQSAEPAMGLDAGWLGTRLEVELPVAQNTTPAGYKSIVPEMINQRFMWVEDYFHYDDWRDKQKAVFDNFNLLQVPSSNQEAQKFFFDKDTHSRRVPQGVFPYPNHKRQLMLPASHLTMTQEFLRSDKHDDYVLFEKEPFKMMVVQELKKAETLAPIDESTSFITNLQNIKQGLKSDYSDKEILNTILMNMSFTDQLIEEHLKGGKGSKEQPQLVHRDAKNFRRFVESTYFSKDREDPFTHFYLKEVRGKEAIKKMIDEEKQLKAEIEEESKDASLIEAGEKRRQALQDKIEEILLAEEARNEDLLNVSDSLESHVQVNYDMKTLVKSEFVYDVDPEVVDQSMSDEEYLEMFRRRAETKLIKSKIIFKLYGSTQAQLSPQEKQYLKKWMADLRSGKDRNLLNLRDSMVPKKHSNLAIKDVDAKSLYSLNSISRVALERDRHGAFALNDLVVELSHFLDEDVVNKVETEVFSDRLRSEWGLSKDFKVVETRNKEISLVLNELEELAWRSAGMLSEQDFNHLKAMISVKRNKDYFDKQFYPQDMQSFKTFFETVNAYDDRMALLERWLIRKEDEIKQRVVRPPAQLQKSDQELFAEIDAPMKRARERLTAKLLTADEFGNPLDKKDYKDLTSRELHSLTENLCLRLYLFNYEYPAFLPQVVRAVMEHPSLQKSDQDQLELYARMFELDWRGDTNYKNKQEFMATHPIYIKGSNLKSQGEISDAVVKEKLQRACAPYVEEAAHRLIANAANQ